MLNKLLTRKYFFFQLAYQTLQAIFPTEREKQASPFTIHFAP